jgi:hypothetical protein
MVQKIAQHVVKRALEEKQKEPLKHG